uniref:Laccase n=1 Tax=Timema bartmani TaxID=61472 RepID=A0A7R9HYM8_9NEOP|nr:unnamed protein product [Timema bartmani]
MTRCLDVVEAKGVWGKSHPCYRKCLPGLTSTCVYNFTISEHGTMALQCGDCPTNLTHCSNVGCIQAGGIIRVSSVVNQQIPGPGIQTPHMDGVPFLTQCPIQPHTDFTYKFVADTPGTHMWHSHIGFEESDGLFGPLVVRRPLTSDPSSPHYDYDLAEHYMIVWHWYSQPSSQHLTTALHRNGSVYGAGLIINGKGGLENFGAGWKETYSKMPRETFTISKVGAGILRILRKGKRYRFRLAFNSAVYCPVQMSIDQHKLTVIASESASFQPVEVSSLMINGGERYDVVVKGDQIPGNYWIRFRALGDCYKDHIKVHQEAVLHYQETEEGLPLAGTAYEDGRVTGKVLNPMQVSVTNYTEDSIILVSDLNNTDFNQEVDVSGEPDHVEYLYFDFNSFDLSCVCGIVKALWGTVGRYAHKMYIRYRNVTGDNLVAPGPYPQINNKLFGYPSFPLLTQREHVTPDLFCRSNTTGSPHCSDKYCKCPYVIDLPLDSLVEIVLIDISIIRDQDHPFHLHGYSFHVVAMGTVGENVTLDYIRDLNEKGKIPKKLNNAPIKDTVSVPTRGYAILRFVTSNPGYWFFHCHISNHVEMGMALVMKVGDHEDMLEEPEDFPTCGSWQRKADSGDEKQLEPSVRDVNKQSSNLMLANDVITKDISYLPSLQLDLYNEGTKKILRTIYINHFHEKSS